MERLDRVMPEDKACKLLQPQSRDNKKHKRKKVKKSAASSASPQNPGNTPRHDIWRRDIYLVRCKTYKHFMSHMTQLKYK